MPKHQPAEYKVTVIEGDEPLSEQAIQQVTKILLESKRKREEKNGTKHECKGINRGRAD